MILFKTALRELKNNIRMVVIMLLQIVVALMITAVMVSAVLLKYQTYEPFKDYFESEGLFLNYGTEARENSDPDDVMSVFHDSQKLLEKTHGSEIIAAHHLYMYMDKKVLDLAYDDEIIHRYTPPLKEGRWLNPNAEELEIVVCENNEYGWKLGDMADIRPGWHFSNDNTKSVWCKAKVVGIVKENAEIFGDTNRKWTTPTYKNAYRPFNAEVEERTLIIMSQSVVKRVDPHYTTPICGTVMIKYPEGTPAEVIKEDRSVLSKYGAGFSMMLPELDINSKVYLYEQLYQMLPIIVILLILVMVSSISTSAISARRRLKDYAKYYVLGLRWRQCALVNFFQALVISAAALVISCAGLLVIGNTALSETFVVIWNAPMILCLLGILLMYLVFSMIMPMIMLRSNTPKAILQSE